MARRLISECSTKVNGCFSRDFESVKGAADRFVTWAKAELEAQDYDSSGQRRMLFVQSQLPQKRNDDNPLGTYRVDVFNRVMDTCVSSFNTRFNPESQDMLQDLALHDPHSFHAIEKDGLPINALSKLTSSIKQIYPEITQSALQEELVALAQHWHVIKLGRLEEYRQYQPCIEELSSDEDDEESERNMSFVGEIGTSDHLENCRNCGGCVYLLLNEYNMLTNAFQSIGLAYRYMLTLSVTQVTCERTFSALKLIKTHVRSRLSQDNLEALILMKCDAEITFNIDNEHIIDEVANNSAVYAKLLKY